MKAAIDDLTVSITGLTKRYPKSSSAAVDGIDLSARRGETIGLLGPNGAGKSTTIAVCTTRVTPTSGRVQVAGLDVTRSGIEVRRRIGVVTQHNTLDRSCTVAQNLYYHCRYFGMSRPDARARSAALLERFALGPRGGHRPAWLSGGLVQRVQIARAIAHRPRVLFLDEPTAGLDPQSRLALWDILTELRADGTTIFLTTHQLEEAERLCDRVAIMDHGRILTHGTPRELTAATGAVTIVRIGVQHPAPDVEAALLAVPGVTAVRPTGSGYEVLTTRGQTGLAEIVPVANRALITELGVQEPSLEDVFITLTGRNLRD